jgi:hypothetical protein
MTVIMFIDDFVPVPRSLLATNAWLLSHGANLAREAASRAVSASEVSLGPFRSRGDALVIPLTWSGPVAAAFRQIAGDLETAALAPEMTHLRLSATCDLAVEPPGRRAQELAAGRTTEQSVRAFLAHLAQAVEQHALVGR